MLWVKKLAATSGEFFEEILIALTCAWAEHAILLEGHPIDAIVSEIEASTPSRVVVVGSIFDHVLRRFGHERLAEAEDKRLQSIWDLVNASGKRVIQQAGGNRRRAPARGKPRSGSACGTVAVAQRYRDFACNCAHPGKRAKDFLQRSFKSSMYDPEGDGADTVFSERIMNPLIHALRFDGIEVSDFLKLHERLGV